MFALLPLLLMSSSFYYAVLFLIGLNFKKKESFICKIIFILHLRGNMAFGLHMR